MARWFVLSGKSGRHFRCSKGRLWVGTSPQASPRLWCLPPCSSPPLPTTRPGRHRVRARTGTRRSSVGTELAIRAPLSPFYQPDQAPEIVRVQSNFQKRNMAAGEWLTWKPYWRNRWTGSYAPQEEFRPGTYVPPGEFPHPGSPLTLDLPSSPWDNHGKLSFARGYYDVGAAYGWWGGPARGWIIDWNWLPRNVSNNGYLGLDLGNGNFIDYVCGLDPGRFLSPEWPARFRPALFPATLRAFGDSLPVPLLRVRR